MSWGSAYSCRCRGNRLGPATHLNSEGAHSLEVDLPRRLAIVGERDVDWKIFIDDWKKAKNPHQVIEASVGYTVFLEDVVWPRDG